MALSKLSSIGIAAVLILLFVPAVLADYPENFDSYSNGATSPGVWTQTTTGTGSCFSGTNILYAPSYASGPALSQPNVYQFAASNTAGCDATANKVLLTAGLNATSPTVTLTFYYSVTVPLASNSTNYAFLISVCGFVSGSDLVFLAHGTTYYSKVTYTVSSSGCGATPTVYFELAGLNSGAAHAVAVQIDNVLITGANVITSGANFFLINAQTGAWFNIANYTGSYVLVEFPTGPPVFYYNITIPDLVINTAGAANVTVWVGQSYFVSIIPAQSGNNYVYLNPPDSPVLPYTLEVQDLSGKFGPGTDVYVYQGNRVMYSGPSDGSNTVPLWLIPGTYRIVLMSGTNTYSTGASFPSVSGSTIIIQILSVTIPSQCGTQCSVSYVAGFNPAEDHIVIYFNDSEDQTTYIADSIFIANASGTFLLYQATWHGAYGEFTDSISCASKACNVANASQMYVNLSYNGADGSDSVNLPLSGGSFFTHGLNIPPNFLGMDILFPAGSGSFNAILSYLLILGVASTFGVFSAKFGVVVTAGVTAALAYAGWLPVAPAGITLILGMAVIAFIAALERS